MIECHRSASDGGEEVEEAIICGKSAGDGRALAAEVVFIHGLAKFGYKPDMIVKTF